MAKDEYGISDEALKLLIQELLTVSKGAAAQRLRTLVQDMMPKDRASADRFMAIVKRIKLATEAMEGSALEAYQTALSRQELE